MFNKIHIFQRLTSVANFYAKVPDISQRKTLSNHIKYHGAIDYARCIILMY